MSKYSRKAPISDETKEEALKVAKGTQRPGQTKEQTKLIAQGIQKGIDLYKKQQKAKARELNKKLKQVKSNQILTEISSESSEKEVSNTNTRLPWLLLLFSWFGFIAYIAFSNGIFF